MSAHHRVPRLAPPRLGLRDAATWLHWLDEAFGPARARLWHSRAVWHRVAAARRHELAGLDIDRLATLELAALLHDVGRALDPNNLEPHGFVGARFLDSLGLHDVAPLVAHHSAAQQEAADRGMAHLDVWESDRELVDVLTYVDRTTSSKGEPTTFDERRADLVARYGAAAPEVRWFDTSMPSARAGELAFHRHATNTAHQLIA